MDVRRHAVSNHIIYHDFLEYVQMFCTNIGKIEKTEKTAIMSEKRKLQPSFLTGRGQELNSWIWWWGRSRWWWRDNDDGDGDDNDDKATYLAVYIYNKCIRKHKFW